MSKNILLPVILLITIGASGVYLLPEHQADTVSISESIDEGMDTSHVVIDDSVKDQLLNMQTEIRMLREELNQLKQTQFIESVAAEDNRHSQNDEQPTRVNESVLIQQEQQRVDQVVDHIAYVHSNQETDQVWATEVGAKLENLFQTEETAGMSLSEVDCRSSLCKMEIQLDSEIDKQQVQFNLMHKLTEFLPRGTVREYTDVYGQTRMLAYFSKPGHQLPNLAHEELSQEMP